MPSKPVLSQTDRTTIKETLLTLCEQFWVTKGYKKTSIKDLCTKAEIAIGTFYSLFPTKEALFLETAKNIETRLTEQFLQTLLQGSNKSSLAKALKLLFREFDSKPFLYAVNTPDFQAFFTKLSEKQVEEIKFENITFLKEVCQITNLQPKIDEAKACAILSALLSTIGTKETLSKMCDYLEVFDFMVDCLIEEIFE